VSEPRILFIRLGSMGDVVRTLPALRVVRERLPGAHVAWAVEEPAAPLLRAHPDLDEVHVLRRAALAEQLAGPDTFFEGVLGAISFVKELRSRAYTTSLDFQGTFKSGLLAILSGAPTRAGFDRRSVRESSHLFSNLRIELPPPPVHRVVRNLLLLEALGFERGIAPPAVVLPVTEQDRAAADRALAEAGVQGHPFVLLYPGSSRRQEYKRYPPERFGAVGAMLSEAGLHVVVGHGPGEREGAETVRSFSGDLVHLLPPVGLLTLAEVIRRSRAYIGGDTGPMHLAWIQAVPVIALFGPTDPALNAPWGEGHVVLDASRDPARLSPAPSRSTASGPAGARRRDPTLFETLDPADVARATLERLGMTPAPGAGMTTDLAGPPPPASPMIAGGAHR
jgi:lipopolysaccharide heptosyltransferase I